MIAKDETHESINRMGRLAQLLGELGLSDEQERRVSAYADIDGFYRLEVIRRDDGVLSAKIPSLRDITGKRYAVSIDPRSGRRECSCRAYVDCVHMGALLEYHIMAQRARLSRKPQAPPRPPSTKGARAPRGLLPSISQIAKRHVQGALATASHERCVAIVSLVIGKPHLGIRVHKIQHCPDAEVAPVGAKAAKSAAWYMID